MLIVKMARNQISFFHMVLKPRPKISQHRNMDPSFTSICKNTTCIIADAQKCLLLIRLKRMIANLSNIVFIKERTTPRYDSAFWGNLKRERTGGFLGSQRTKCLKSTM